MAAGVAVIVVFTAMAALRLVAARYEYVIGQNEIDLAQTYSNLGTLYMERAGGRSDAIRAFEVAAKNWESLARKYPRDPSYRTKAAAIRDSLASIPPPVP
jgi:hypothetical protein